MFNIYHDISFDESVPKKSCATWGEHYIFTYDTFFFFGNSTILSRRFVAYRWW